MKSDNTHYRSHKKIYIKMIKKLSRKS